MRAAGIGPARTTIRAWALALYRARGPIFYVSAALLVANVVVLQFSLPRPAKTAWAAAVVLAMVALLASFALSAVIPRCLPEALLAPSRTVHSPVEGRWLGLNSPTSQVPSHGTRAYGQAYAIDLVHGPICVGSDPAGAAQPAVGGGAMPAATEYPAFGEPVLAMIDGTVVRASGWRRDHRARAGLAGFAYLAAEGFVRQLGGAGFVVGNHVTIRGDDGCYAAVGHLKRGSVAVSVGDRVTAGTRIGACGNSGNSSEPHVHAQLMDRVSFWTAQGIPMAFSGITIDGEPTAVDGLPGNGQYMVASSAHR